MTRGINTPSAHRTLVLSGHCEAAVMHSLRMPLVLLPLLLRAQRPARSEKNMHQTKQLLRDTFITSIRGNCWKRVNVQGCGSAPVRRKKTEMWRKKKCMLQKWPTKWSRQWVCKCLGDFFLSLGVMMTTRAVKTMRQSLKWWICGWDTCVWNNMQLIFLLKQHHAIGTETLNNRTHAYKTLLISSPAKIMVHFRGFCE